MGNSTPAFDIQDNNLSIPFIPRLRKAEEISLYEEWDILFLNGSLDEELCNKCKTIDDSVKRSIKKKVTFDSDIQIRYIPTMKELSQLVDQLFWNTLDLSRFKSDYYEETRTFLQVWNVSQYEVTQLLYQPFHNANNTNEFYSSIKNSEYNRNFAFPSISNFSYTFASIVYDNDNKQIFHTDDLIDSDAVLENENLVIVLK